MGVSDRAMRDAECLIGRIRTARCCAFLHRHNPLQCQKFVLPTCEMGQRTFPQGRQTESDNIKANLFFEQIAVRIFVLCQPIELAVVQNSVICILTRVSVTGSFDCS